MIQRFTGGVDMTENGQGLSAIRVGPGQHFLGYAHTRQTLRQPSTARKLLITTASSNGRLRGLDAAARASKLARRLDKYEGPELEPAIDEALQAFMAERKAAFRTRTIDRTGRSARP